MRKRSHPGAASGQSGFALLIVLWASVVLSLIVTTMLATARSETQRTANVLSAAVTQAAADAGVQLAAMQFLDRPGQDWAANGASHVVSMPDGVRVDIRVESEDGKINPNLASPDLLGALLQEVGASRSAASAIADNILQWRVEWLRPGADNPALTAYRTAGLSYGPPGKPFRTLDEVGAVLGMTPELLARIRPYLSIYARNEPDLAYASRTVLAAIGAEPNAAMAKQSLPNVLGISVIASKPGGTRFVRHAIVQLGRERGQDPIRILAWTASDDE